MSYTKEPIVIDNPSEKLLKTIKKLREHKLSELEKLRVENKILRAEKERAEMEASFLKKIDAIERRWG